MNDYQMTHLANEHRASLQATADRERLARSARPIPSARPDAKPRLRRLSMILGRVALSW